MRHGKKFNHLGRTASHRGAMLSNMATSLILNKRINTTVAKAKALRKYIEPIITKAKTDTTHSRRVAFSYLQSKESVQELFSTIAEKIATRPGGYVRIIKTGTRLGDNAEMCMMELVDFNELLVTDSSPSKGKSRRSRRGGKGKSQETAETTANVDTVVEEAEVIEETEESKVEEVTTEAEQVSDSSEEIKEEVKVDEVKAETTEEAPIEEESKDENKEDKKEE